MRSSGWPRPVLLGETCRSGLATGTACSSDTLAGVPKGVWETVVAALGGDEDLEALMLDSSVVRAHQHAAGDKKGG